MADSTQHRLKVCELVMSDNCDGAHNIAQNYSDNTANWIHAVCIKLKMASGTVNIGIQKQVASNT